MSASRSQVSNLRANGEIVRTGFMDCYWIDIRLRDCYIVDFYWIDGLLVDAQIQIQHP